MTIYDRIIICLCCCSIAFICLSLGIMALVSGILPVQGIGGVGVIGGLMWGAESIAVWGKDY